MLTPILSVNENPDSQYLQGAAGLQQQQQQQWGGAGPGEGGPGGVPGVGHVAVGPMGKPQQVKPKSKPRYFIKLFVNGRVVDTSTPVPMGEDFVAQFNETFSVQVGHIAL